MGQPCKNGLEESWCLFWQNHLSGSKKGRICAWGEHFATARDEEQFPVDVYALREDLDLPQEYSTRQNPENINSV